MLACLLVMIGAKETINIIHLEWLHRHSSTHWVTLIVALDMAFFRHTPVASTAEVRMFCQ